MLYLNNRIGFILFNTGSWSEGAFISFEPDHHDVMQHLIQISRNLYTSWTGSAWFYITLYLDQQERLTQKNQIKKTLSKLDPDQQLLYQWNLVRMLLYNTGLWSAGFFYTHWTGSAWRYTTLYRDQQEMLYQENRNSIMVYNSRSDQQDISYNTIGSVWCCLTLHSDQQENLYR